MGVKGKDRKVKNETNKEPDTYYTRQQYPKNKQWLFHDHYKDGVKSITGEGQGIRPLTSEETKWLNKFHDGTIANNHKYIDIFNQHPEYQERIKTELYRETNARNVDLYGITTAGKLMADYDELFNYSSLLANNNKYDFENIMTKLGVRGFENTVTSLVNGLIDQIGGKITNTNILSVMSFYYQLTRVIKEEKRTQRVDKDLANRKLE